MLINYIYKFTIFVVSLWLFSLVLASPTNAQSCSGSAGCCSRYIWVYPACDPRDPACPDPTLTCSSTISANCGDFLAPECDTLPNIPTQCQGGFFANCSSGGGGGSGPSCQANGACQTTCCSSGVNHSDPTCSSGLRCGSPGTPPPPPPTGGWGACGSCSSCPPFGGSSQCVTAPDGTCVWDPGRCSGGGSGACRITGFNPSPVTLYQGDTIPMNVTAFNGIFQSTVTGVRWAMGAIGTPWNVQSNATAQLGALFTGVSGSNNLSSNTIRGLTNGTTLIKLQYRVRDNNYVPGGSSGEYFEGGPIIDCERTVPIAVIPRPASCTLNLPDSINVVAGTTTPLNVPVTPVNGTINRVNFSSADAAIASVAPGVDNTPPSPYQTVITGNNTGLIAVTVRATMNGGTTCSDQIMVNVTAPGAWWQTMGGNVTSGGSVSSSIPSGCTGSCVPYLIKNPTLGSPGVVVYGGSSSVTFGSTGQASQPNWRSGTDTVDPTYDYDYAYDLLPSGWNWNDITTTTFNGNLNSGDEATDDYIYQRVTVNPGNQNFNISSPQNIGGKVILFVDGNLNINAPITLNGPNSFFMAVVKGNINVAGSVGNATNPSLEGYYLAGQNFSTGTSATKLIVNGSVVAYGSINLQRDLAGGNSTQAAEEFRQNPRLTLLFPPALTKDAIIWEEVAP